MSERSLPPRAHCAWCESDRPLKKDGTFRQHNWYPWGGGYTSRVTVCHGSGRTPEAARDYIPESTLEPVAQGLMAVPRQDADVDAVSAAYWQTMWEREHAHSDALRERVATLETALRQAINEILYTCLTPRGVELWWDRERYQLDGRTPEQTFDTDPVAVFNLAIGGMAQNGS